MRCSHCGSQLPEGSKFCTNCGAPQEQPKQEAPSYESFASQERRAESVPQGSQARTVNPEYTEVSFFDAVKLFFTRYTDFGGRSRRSEFWWAYLFLSLVGMGLSTMIQFYEGFALLSSLWSLAILVPNLALRVRRLHDVGKSWVWLLWYLLPLVGGIVLLVQYTKDSDTSNQWGPCPKGY